MPALAVPVNEWNETLFMASRRSTEEKPVRLTRQGGGRVCVVQGYVEAIQVLTNDTEVERTTAAGMRHGQAFSGLPRWLAQAMSRQQCEALRPDLERLASDLAAAVMARGKADLVEEFTIPFTFSGLCTAIGAPASQHPALYAWRQDAHRTVQDVEDPDGPHWQSAHQFTVPLVTTGAAGQGLGRILAAEIQAGRLEPDQANMSLGLVLLDSAHASITRLISDTLLLLLTDPGKRALLIAQPGKVPAALEEMLRYSPPSWHAGVRRTRCPFRLGEVEVPGGTTLDVVIGVANRDPRHFRDPGRIDFDRDEAQHLAFGYGSSYCSGARLARTQAEIAIRTMLPYLEQLALAIPVEQIEWSNRRPGYSTMLDILPVACRD
jgi:cytochrome P450